MFNFPIDWMIDDVCRWCRSPVKSINIEYEMSNSKRSFAGNFTHHVLTCHEKEVIEFLGEKRGKKRIEEMKQALREELE